MWRLAGDRIEILDIDVVGTSSLYCYVVTYFSPHAENARKINPCSHSSSNEFGQWACFMSSSFHQMSLEHSCVAILDATLCRSAAIEVQIPAPQEQQDQIASNECGKDA